MKRQFILTVNYKNENSEWDTISHDVIQADDLLSLLNQFNVLILSLHKRLLIDEGSEIR